MEDWKRLVLELSKSPKIDPAIVYWTHTEAVILCTEIEAFAPKYGCHIGLTGGCLYKNNYRKDLDILIYRIRQVEKIDWVGFIDHLKVINITITRNTGFVKKAIYKPFIGHPQNIDFLYPEYYSFEGLGLDDGTY